MNKLHKFLNLVLFFATCIFLGVCVIVYFKKTGEVELASKKPESAQLSPEELVNKYLKDGQSKVQTDQINSLQTLKKTTPEPEVAKKNKEVRIEDIPESQQIAKLPDKKELSLTEKFDEKAYDEQLRQAQSAQAKKDKLFCVWA